MDAPKPHFVPIPAQAHRAGRAVTDSSQPVPWPREESLAEAAREAGKVLGAGFDILVIGPDAKAAAAELTNYGAGKVLAAEIAAKGYICEHYAPTVAEVATQMLVTSSRHSPPA